MIMDVPGRCPMRSNSKKKNGESMRVQLTAVFEKVPLGYIAYVEELPGANTQGRTLEEARSNLFEAVEMTIEANRNLSEEEIHDRVMIKEPFAVLTA
jgi:predicted RNase H-like HicB family nuclease